MRKMINEFVEEGFYPTAEEEPLIGAAVELGLTSAQVKAKLIARRGKQDAEVKATEAAEARGKTKQAQRAQLVSQFPAIFDGPAAGGRI
jgi:hypothetical protein